MAIVGRQLQGQQQQTLWMLADADKRGAGSCLAAAIAAAGAAGCMAGDIHI